MKIEAAKDDFIEYDDIVCVCFKIKKIFKKDFLLFVLSPSIVYDLNYYL